MSQKYLIRIAELESQLRQKDQQLSLVEETEAFLRSALARAEEKIEEDEREIEHLRAQIEKLHRMLFGNPGWLHAHADWHIFFSAGKPEFWLSGMQKNEKSPLNPDRDP